MKSNKVYKHAELLQAWAQGAEVEYRVNGEWRQMPSCLEATKVPHFYTDQEYRLKPFEGRFRVGSQWANGSLRLFVAKTLEEEMLFSSSVYFVGWVSEWQEFTLEVQAKNLYN